ncbi:MAG: hypothetical protein AAFP70_04265 [Calditrichota bacterium]
MKNLTILFYEWKHFTRSPFKIVALFIFIAAGIYALHNGAGLYHQQMKEINKVQEKVKKDRSEILAFYDAGKKGPESRPWVDVNNPYWAVWYASPTHFKTPSPAKVYSTGQAEQFGFYKKVSFWDTPYDADMAEEIANPERLQFGTLDFSFVMLYLMPLLLLILLYNIKGVEADSGILPLIYAQASSKNTWLASRIGFYAILMAFTTIGLMLYGAVLTNVLSSEFAVFGQFYLYLLLYLLFWSIIYFFVLKYGQSLLTNTMLMAGIWLLFTFIIPATVHQVVSVKHPVNLMTEWIDAQRDERQNLFNQPDSTFQAMLIDMFPEIERSPILNDSLRVKRVMNRSASALANELTKNSIAPIEEANAAKNNLIKSSYFFNPVAFFQNQLNSLSETHYSDYQNYRNEIQMLIDKQIAVMVTDLWKDTQVDKSTYLGYLEQISLDGQ